MARGRPKRWQQALRALLRHRSPQKELIQRTFLACVEAKDRFRGDSKFSTYLLGIALRQVYEHYDRRRRHAERLNYQTVSVAALDPTPSQIIAAHDEQRLLLQACDRSRSTTR